MATATADAAGVASTSYVENSNGPHSYIAYTDFGTTYYSNAVTVTVTAPTITLGAPETATAGQPFQLNATVTNVDGSPISGVSVQLQRGPGMGYSYVGWATTDASGVAIWSRTENDPGDDIFHVTASYLGSTIASDDVTVTVAAHPGLTLTGPDTVTTGQSFTLTATLYDASNSPLAGQSITFERSTGTSFTPLTSEATSNDGTATLDRERIEPWHRHLPRVCLCGWRGVFERADYRRAFVCVHAYRSTTGRGWSAVHLDRHAHGCEQYWQCKA